MIEILYRHGKWLNSVFRPSFPPKRCFGGKDGLKTLFNHFPCRYRISIIGCHTQIAVKPPRQLLGFVEPCWIGERKQSIEHQPAESFVMFGAGEADSCKTVVA